MARTTATNFTGALQFPYATAATDLFHKEDIQTLAQAVDQHDHSTGKGLAVVNPPTVPLVGNELTNPGFEWWQRGNGPFTASGAYGPDRWVVNLIGTDTLSVSRDTSNVDTGSPTAAALTFTLGTGAGGSNLQQKMEDPQLKGRTVSFSVRVRASVANAVRIGVWDSVNSYRYSIFHTGGGTYETLTVTAPVAAGTTATSVVVGLSASCTAYVDNACLVVGSTPATYEPLHPADDLARCLRYYEYCGESATELAITGYQTVGQPIDLYIPYKARKPVTPTVTKQGTWGVLNCGQPAVNAFGLTGLTARITATATGLTSVQNNTAGCCFVVEANP